MKGPRRQGRARAALIALAAAIVSLAAVLALAHQCARSVRAAAHPDQGDFADYASPLELLLSPDGARLYVLCQQSEEVRVLNSSTFAVIASIGVGRVPRGFSLSPSGDRLYVTNSWDDTLSVIDTRRLAVLATWPVG
ncbi:MAG TPA: beta-propeller fold lactonase family protein, partial [Terracidiphilus sp.]|nr:beta-propeller fold lactonase family protein [Terracidiphilus sp.]